MLAVNDSQWLRLHTVPDRAQLAARVGQWLRPAPLDPFARFLVCVPDPGTGRWLAQRFADSNADEGVCAGVDFRSLSGWCNELLAEATGLPRAHDPWRPAALAWTVLSVVEAARHEPWAAQVWTHIDGPDAAPGARLATARRIAGLFARYALRSPQLLDAWRDGRDVGADGQPLAAWRDGTYAWQPPLWRACRDALLAQGVDDPVARLHDLGPQAVEPLLPERIAVVAPGPLPASHAELLTRVGSARPIDVFALPRANDPVATRLGRFGRRAAQDWEQLAGAPWPAPDAADPSPTLGRNVRVGVHVSHGPDRQVEVLRDCLLEALQHDPSLEPRDIVVLSPNLELFGPLLEAAFSPDEEEHAHPGHRIRVRLARRQTGHAQPVLAVVEEALGLAGSRLGASDVLGLLSRPAVTSRFGWDSDRFARLSELVYASGVRWGLDADQQRAEGLPDGLGHTWRDGLDRLALGVALSEDDLLTVGEVFPFDDVESDSVALVGDLLCVDAALRRFWAGCAEAHTLAEWVALCHGLIDTAVAPEPGEGWQLEEAHAALGALLDDATTSVPIDLAEFRLLVHDQAAAATGRASFGNGSTVVCAPGELSAAQHRVVCLLGFDADCFPRSPALDGDDLLADAEPDLDVRACDRQALVDAVGGASEELIVIYRGHDPLTNAAVAPSVPLAELLEGVQERAVVTEHPLQPFSPRNFSGAPDAPLSFDAAALEGARALLRSPTEPAVREVGSEAPLSPLPLTVSLREIEQFFKHPARRFLRARAGLSDGVDAAPPPDELPLDVGGLEQWAIGNRLLTSALAGQALDQALAIERLRGTLPVGEGGHVVLADVEANVREILDGTRALREQDLSEHDIAVDVELPGIGAGHRVLVTGSVRSYGDLLLDVGYSRIGPAQRLSAWIRLLALGVAEPGPWRWTGVGRGSRSSLGPVPPTWAEPGLANLVELYCLGLSTPLPLPLRTAEAYAQAILRGADATDRRFARRLTKPWEFDLDATWARFYPDLETLLGTRPVESDSRVYAEPSRFGTLARRVWEPLLRVEKGGHS